MVYKNDIIKEQVPKKKVTYNRYRKETSII